VKLKKLELYGFKSFADRTVFEFEDSLSALVGPNGAGKSNVVDAIKWVLGERSAQKLRGAEMTNVIFGGSESRKPVNFADVKLTIDNSDHWLPVDFEEVCIQRRIDTTAQCEYYINGQQCRLKDIRHLLMDTGVGTNCYSVIEQGQIDRILRSNPKERRQVFEEAAGINRFLEHKKEAERKLERVAANLLRVNDILEELEQQLRSVKYQAARARTFKHHAERLQRLRLAHGLHSYRALEAEKAGHARAIEEASGAKARLAEQAASAEAALEAARTQLQNAQTALSGSRERLAHIDARLESLAREAALNRKQSEELGQRLKELDQRRRALEQRAGDLGAEIGEATAKLQQSAQELADKTARFAAGQQQIENARRQFRQAEGGLETKKATVFDLFQQDAHLRNQIEVLGAERRALQSRLERLDNRQAELNAQLSQIDGERASAQGSLDALQAQQAELDARLQQLKRSLAEAEERLRAVAAEEAEAKAAVSGKVARHEVLHDLEARAEGVGSGVKRLLDAHLPGTVGLVGQKLEVPLDKAAAVEAALGDKAQAIIIEGSAEARQGLKLLAEENAGRAELIVLEHIAPPDRAGLNPVPSVEGRLSDLVRPDEQAARAVELLLGNVLLVEDAERAMALLRAGLPSGVRLVTPAGECYGADGVWAGGEPETPSIVSRRSELAALDVQIADLERRLTSLSEQRQVYAQQVEGLEAERESHGSRADDVRRKATEAASRLQAVSTRANELREELHLAGIEQATLRRDIEDMHAQAASLQERSEQVRRERADAQQAIDAEQARLHAMQEEQQAVAEQLNALSGDLARTREQQRSLQSLAERLQADKQRAESDLAGLLAEQQKDAKRLDEAAKAAESAATQAEALRAERSALCQALEADSAGLQGLRERISVLAGQTGELAQQRQQIDERLHALRMAENETAIKMRDMLDRVAEDYGVRLQSLVAGPETWREAPPFTAKLIREFAENLPESAGAGPAEPVAAWYKEQEASEAAEEEREEEAPEVVTLEETTELRGAVLELADNPATDWEQVKTDVARLKAYVERVGNVNVAAIRQQEELEVRFQFLTDQKEDLETARRHQRDIVRELNKKSRERFREVFEQVRQNFQTLFRKLFEGGTADIILEQATEEEDILEAGVEMVARPPGKETNSITLLSGGERALTTIALLFAIFQSKPSPFCLLDEVDAPLDDNNVERFLMLLDEFRNNTQFVIITHNKVTMSAAQVLYGLTMADGVSKKISVKFEEVDRKLDQMPEAQAKAG
jgi:chromosome segregation protein